MNDALTLGENKYNLRFHKGPRGGLWGIPVSGFFVLYSPLENKILFQR